MSYSYRTQLDGSHSAGDISSVDPATNTVRVRAPGPLRSQLVNQNPLLLPNITIHNIQLPKTVRLTKAQREKNRRKLVFKAPVIPPKYSLLQKKIIEGYQECIGIAQEFNVINGKVKQDPLMWFVLQKMAYRLLEKSLALYLVVRNWWLDWTPNELGMTPEMRKREVRDYENIEENTKHVVDFPKTFLQRSAAQPTLAIELKPVALQALMKNFESMSLETRQYILFQTYQMFILADGYITEIDEDIKKMIPGNDKEGRLAYLKKVGWSTKCDTKDDTNTDSKNQGEKVNFGVCAEYKPYTDEDLLKTYLHKYVEDTSADTETDQDARQRILKDVDGTLRTKKIVSGVPIRYLLFLAHSSMCNIKKVVENRKQMMQSPPPSLAEYELACGACNNQYEIMLMISDAANYFLGRGVQDKTISITPDRAVSDFCNWTFHANKIALDVIKKQNPFGYNRWTLKQLFWTCKHKHEDLWKALMEFCLRPITNQLPSQQAGYGNDMEGELRQLRGMSGFKPSNALKSSKNFRRDKATSILNEIYKLDASEQAEWFAWSYLICFQLGVFTMSFNTEDNRDWLMWMFGNTQQDREAAVTTWQNVQRKFEEWATKPDLAVYMNRVLPQTPEVKNLDAYQGWGVKAGQAIWGAVKSKGQVIGDGITKLFRGLTTGAKYVGDGLQTGAKYSAPVGHRITQGLDSANEWYIQNEPYVYDRARAVADYGSVQARVLAGGTRDAIQYGADRARAVADYGSVQARVLAGETTDAIRRSHDFHTLL